ncbi:MAG TPA: CpXC domain-containing protein [Anaerolineales bacterium]|nr:CpXC domain-containing protein [Anaerolineales bacterium]HNO30136.1 CpXC domain-containing protein [Anaerolineales bacterium]
MPQTQIACPRCKQMIAANVEQLFDVTADPQAKQRLLSGQSNHARCPYCGYQGRLATPVVYHDNEKELLLTFFPPELGLPVNEQERMIGPLIKQVMDKLPPEKRKGYLLKPQANLTYESMLETILGKDGVTPEMLKEQQERVQFIERLMQVTSKDVRTELLKQNAKIIDEQFFALFSRIAQSAISSGQEQIARALIDIQTQLLEETEYGRQLKESVGELEAAQKELQEAGQGLTREKLLDFVLTSKTESRIRAYVSLARGGMDYVFFQDLTERIDKASGEEKARLENIRESLLKFVSDMDKQLEARYKQAQDFIEKLLAQDDIERVVQANLENFTQDAVDIANQMLRQASEKNDYARMGKLQKMIQVLQAASAPPEVMFIEQLIQLPDDAAIEAALTQNGEMVTQQLLDTLSGLVNQMDSQPDNPEAQAMGEKLSEVYKIALKLSMKKNMG